MCKAKKQNNMRFGGPCISWAYLLKTGMMNTYSEKTHQKRFNVTNRTNMNKIKSTSKFSDLQHHKTTQTAPSF